MNAAQVLPFRWIVAATLLGAAQTTFAAATNTVTLFNFAFSTNAVTINAGDSVLFKNTQGFHNAKCLDPNCGPAFSNTPQSAPWTFAATFATPGVYHYDCQIHPFMTTTITVVAPTPPAVSKVRLASGGTLAFDVAVAPGTQCVVQASADFANWIPVLTNAPASGAFTFTDAVSAARRFYRVTQ